MIANCLSLFTRFHVIDRPAGGLVVSSMRWIPFIASAALLPAAPLFAQTDTETAPPKPLKTPTALPRPTAEPENGQAYGAPLPHEQEGPTSADVGPVQKHFIRQSETDDLAQTQNADNASLAIKQKTALDKRISIPLIHDVQNNGPNTGPENHALQYEITYLNWGAVTQEQLLARTGHYFTITWKNSGPRADFTTRFEYREVKSKEIVRTLTQSMPGIRGATRSYFAVVGKAYLAYGPIVSWRFSVLQGDTVVAQARSFIW